MRLLEEAMLSHTRHMAGKGHMCQTNGVIHDNDWVRTWSLPGQPTTLNSATADSAELLVNELCTVDTKLCISQQMRSQQEHIPRWCTYIPLVGTLTPPTLGFELPPQGSYRFRPLHTTMCTQCNRHIFTLNHTRRAHRHAPEPKPGRRPWRGRGLAHLSDTSWAMNKL